MVKNLSNIKYVSRAYFGYLALNRNRSGLSYRDLVDDTKGFLKVLSDKSKLEKFLEDTGAYFFSIKEFPKLNFDKCNMYYQYYEQHGWKVYLKLFKDYIN